MTDPLQEAASVLRAGGVVLHATEGVWGLACDPHQRRAVEKILDIKGRAAAKGVILIGGGDEVFSAQLDQVSRAHADQVRASWPGHHTWILPDSCYPDYITGGRGTIAARVPNHAQARGLCEEFGGALVSTSANRSGEPPASNAVMAQRTLGDEVDFFLPGEVGAEGRDSIIHGLDGEILR